MLSASISKTIPSYHPVTAGCQVDGECYKSGDERKTKLKDGVETCVCKGKDWSCFAVGNPVFLEPPPTMVLPPACDGTYRLKHRNCIRMQCKYN